MMACPWPKIVDVKQVAARTAPANFSVRCHRIRQLSKSLRHSPFHRATLFHNRTPKFKHLPGPYRMDHGMLCLPVTVLLQESFYMTKKFLVVFGFLLTIAL